MALGKILLADDDEDDKSIMLDAMELLGEGEVMLFAKHGVEVMEILEKCSESMLPSLIVLDLNMPKLNGTSTLRRLKDDERFREIPVIIYSTSVNPIEQERCLSLGAIAYLTKPLSFDESVERARTFLGFCR